MPDGTPDWIFLAAMRKKRTTEKESGLPRFSIQRFEVWEGGIEYDDRRRAAGAIAQVKPLDFEQAELSTLADEEGRHRLTAPTSLGADRDCRPHRPSFAAARRVFCSCRSANGKGPYLGGALPPQGTLSATGRFVIAREDDATLALEVGK